MNKLILVIGVALLIGSVYFQNNDQDQSNGYDTSIEINQNFIQFKISQNKKYSSVSEESYRLAVYTQNMLIAQAHNADPRSTWTMGETQFSDLTQQEFAAIYLTLQTSDIADDVEVYEDFDFVSDEEVDWRTQPGVSTHVKNQGRCGSCWAFSVVAAVEAFYATAQGQKDLDLSEQQLVDCSKDGNKGCSGGHKITALNWITEKGLVTQSDYGYVYHHQYLKTAKNGTCLFETGPYKIGGPQKVAADDASLQSALNIRPVAVSVDAHNWSQYKGGILSECGNKTNHAVLAFGYGSDYWLIKNSWGSSWGEAGFIRIKNGNTCNVLESSYLVV